MDYTWPDWNANNAGAVTNQERDRPGAQAANPSGLLSPGATGSVNVGVINGVSCCRLINGANLNGGPVAVVDGAGRLHISTLSANMQFSSATDDYGATRVYAVMRVAATPTDATDCGLEIILGANASAGVLNGAKPGWSIQLDNTGGTSLVQHGNSGAQTSTPLLTVAGGFVNTDFHTFEYRLLNATNLTNGIFKVLIDGVKIVQRSFGVVGDDLPLPSSAGANANNGYVVNVQNMGRNSELDVALVRIQRAPFEAALF
jgi:hypothetical protein